MIHSLAAFGLVLAAAPAALAAPAASAALEPASAAGLVAIRVGKAETGSHGTVEHAVIVIEGTKIVEVGEDLILDRGIEVIDRPDWVVTPGLVNCYSRAGMDSRSGNGFTPTKMASDELYPRAEEYAELLENGVTTLGLYPAGLGVPGQAVAVRPRGDSKEAMILEDGVYLKAVLESSASSKKMLRKGFEEADDYDEKVEKEREKWKKAQEKKKKKSKKKKKDDDDSAAGPVDDDDDEEDEDDGFVPPNPEGDAAPFVALRNRELRALMRISKAGDFLHLLDVLDEEEIDYSLRVPLRNDIDLYEIKDRLAEADLAVVLEPRLTLQPNTRRERNIPAELAGAGARVAFIPRSDSVRSHERWMSDVGLIVATGMERDKAIAAMTLEPARVLGLEERLGSLDKDKDANLVFWTGDPFEPSSRIAAVMLEGEIVYGDVDR